MTKKIITIIGARPQFIKAAVVSRALKTHGGFREVIVHTGQHFDANMSDVFFQELAIPYPDYHLGIGGLSHGAMTGRQLEKVEEVLVEEKPDWVLVYGDTNSTLAGALAAVKLHIPVAHIEAGLRSFKRQMPEEINRVLTDHISNLLFAPTLMAVDNLAKEGIVGDKVKLVGDVMYDAALYYGQLADQKSHILVELGLAEKSYILATVHRAENADDPARLAAIFRAFGQAPLPVVLPLHPRTRGRIMPELLDQSNLRVIEPVGYLDMVALEKNAALITTDSGGVQKEAYFHRVPCVTLREETEWVELVEIGWNRLVSPKLSSELLLNTLQESLMTKVMLKPSLYGKGSAALEISRQLI